MGWGGGGVAGPVASFAQSVILLSLYKMCFDVFSLLFFLAVLQLNS